MKYTEPEKILIAAYKLKEEKNIPIEKLIISVWKSDYMGFGLKGYENQSADSNKVNCYLYGKRGIIKRGWLDVVQPRVYKISELGSKLAQELIEGTPEDRPPVELDSTQSFFLTVSMETQAVQKWLEGNYRDITFVEALDFWNVPENDHKDIEQRIAETKNTIGGLLILLEKQDGKDSQGRVFCYKDVLTLFNCHLYLVERFKTRIILVQTHARKSANVCLCD